MRQKTIETGIIILNLIFLATINPANADDIQLHGFGSTYGSKSLTNDVVDGDFGSDNHIGFGQMSRFGLNVGARLADNLEVAAQFVVDGARIEQTTSAASWNLFVNWAFLNYAPIENLHIKLGRQLVPIWLASEFIEVRFLQPYIRIPSPVFYMAPFTNINGLSGTYSMDSSLGRLSIELFGGETAGESVTPMVSKTSFEQDNLLGVSATMTGDGFRLHAQANRFHAITNVFALSDSSVPGATLVTTVKPPTTEANPILLTLGGSFDKYHVVLWAEYGLFKSSDGTLTPNGPALKNMHGGYIMAGYRLGSFMPRYTFSSADWSGSALPGFGSFTEHTAGVNYYFSDHATFKVEAQIDSFQQGMPTFASVSPSSTSTTGTGIAAGADFIF